VTSPIRLKWNRPLSRDVQRLRSGSNVGSNGRSNRSQSSRTSRVRPQDVVDPLWPHLLHLVARLAHEQIRVSPLLRHL